MQKSSVSSELRIHLCRQQVHTGTGLAGQYSKPSWIWCCFTPFPPPSLHKLSSHQSLIPMHSASFFTVELVAVQQLVFSQQPSMSLEYVGHHNVLQKWPNFLI